jgi:hypothetical protein
VPGSDCGSVIAGEDVRAAIERGCGQMSVKQQLITKSESVLLNFITSFSG